MRAPKVLAMAAALALLGLGFQALGQENRDQAGAQREQQNLQGKIQSVQAEQGQLVVRDQQNKEHRFQVGRTARVNVNGEKAQLADLKEGQQVTVTFRNVATEIRTNRDGANETATDNAKETAANRNQARTQGKIQSVSGEQNQLVLRDQAGKERRFHVGREARVTIDGKAGQLADLRRGQEVSIAYQMMATEIRAGRQE
jgi:hypothetical protein